MLLLLVIVTFIVFSSFNEGVILLSFVFFNAEMSFLGMESWGLCLCVQNFKNSKIHNFHFNSHNMFRS